MDDKKPPVVDNIGIVNLINTTIQFNDEDCLHKNIEFSTKQTRCGDEIETEFVKCKDCGSNVKFQ